MSEAKDLRATSGTSNDRITEVIANLRKVAIEDLGFGRQGTRADDEIELTKSGVRIRYEARYSMGEGRVVLLITKPGTNLRTREIRITGRDTVREETERCRKELLNIVRRVTAVRA